MLEVGCGDGRVSRRLAPLCKSVTGIDTDDRLMSNLIESASNAGIEFLEMDAQTMGFDASSFDLVLFPWSLHQIGDRSQAVREALRVLCPEGYLCVFGLLPGGDYESLVSSLGLDYGPEIDAHTYYENPLSEAFGSILKTVDLNGANYFGFSFPDLDTACDAFDFALRAWHNHRPSQRQREAIRNLLIEYSDASGCPHLKISGRVYLTRKR